MTIANAIWLATAQLHKENARAPDFSVGEIIERAIQDKLVEGYKPGLQVHVSKHCVANKSPNPGNYRMLYETTRGRRRLFKEGDTFHPERKNGKIRPEKEELPNEYQDLTDWFDAVYSKSVALASSPGNSFQVRTDQTASIGSSGTAFVNSTGSFVIPENLRQELGLDTGTRLSIYREGSRLVIQPVTDEFIHSLRGCCKGETSLVEAREREHRIEKNRMSHG